MSLPGSVPTMYTSSNWRRLLFCGVVLLSASTGVAQESPLRWQSSEVTKLVGGYIPQRLKLAADKPAHVKKAPSDLANPLFGELKIGPSNAPGRIVIVIDEPPGKPSRIFVDSNGNGDLTDDPSPRWEEQRSPGGGAQQFITRSGNAVIRIPYSGGPEDATIGIYRFDKRDPSRSALADSVFYYRDYGRSGQLTLGEKSYAAVLVDELASGDFRGTAATAGNFSGIRMLVDVNADGKYDFRRESFDAQQAFNIGGTTWELSNLTPEGKFRVIKSTQTVAELKPAANLAKGSKAIPFTAKTTDGKTIRFPDDYKGKVVLLDFWATWCGPCLAELPNVVENYSKYHRRGFEILGISLDKADSGPQLASFTKEKNMPWPQIYDGKMWQAEIAQVYGVEGIPFMLVVDGDTGEILAGIEARGPLLGPAIETALARKKPSK